MITDFLYTGLAALIMVSPFIIGAIAQQLTNKHKNRGNQ
jgi:hypothetical protein